MYRYNEIKTVHLEITENCNASCPMCARNINGGEDNPHLKGNELSLDDCKTIFPPEFIFQLEASTRALSSYLQNICLNFYYKIIYK